MSKAKKLWRNARKKMTKKWAVKTAYDVAKFLLAVALVYAVVSYAVAKSYYVRDLNLPTGFSVTMNQESTLNTFDDMKIYVDETLNLTADAIEFDVHFLSDGTPVVSSDAVWNLKEAVTLESALHEFSSKNKDMKICLNITEGGKYKNLYSVIEKQGLTERIFLTGISPIDATKIKEQCPNVEFYINLSPSVMNMVGEKYKSKLLKFMQMTGAAGVNCRYQRFNGKLVDFMHENGYKVSVYDVDSRDRVAKVITVGADNVLVDDPGIVNNTIAEWKTTG